MSNKQYFSDFYRDICSNLSDAVDDLSKIKLDHQDGKQQLIQMRDLLGKIQTQFNEELEFLESNSEWDVFSVAFFGETNAGKSTLIESLRILFNEVERQKMIDENYENIDVIEKALTTQVEILRQQLSDLIKHHGHEVKAISAQVSEIKKRNEYEMTVRVRRYLFMVGICGVMVGMGIMAFVKFLPN